MKKKTGKLTKLSAQFALDCCADECSHEDFYSIPENVMSCIQWRRGIVENQFYPYTGIRTWRNETDPKCNPDGHLAANISRIAYVPVEDEERLMRAVAMDGPITSVIDGSQPTFKFYRTGVYSDPKCNGNLMLLTGPYLSVLIVGYGTDEIFGDYWIIKNSYGISWGESGYMRIARFKNNMCGIATWTSYPIP